MSYTTPIVCTPTPADPNKSYTYTWDLNGHGTGLGYLADADTGAVVTLGEPSMSASVVLKTSNYASDKATAAGSPTYGVIVTDSYGNQITVADKTVNFVAATVEGTQTEAPQKKTKAK